MLSLKLKNEFVKNILTLMTGTAMAQAIPVLISPLLTRLYSPEQFGMWALYMSLAGIFGAIANGRYELAIMLPEKRSVAINLFWLSCGIAFVFALLIGIGVIFFANDIAALMANPGFAPWLYALPVSVLLVGSWQALSNWHNREKNYKKMAYARVIQAITNAGVALSLGFLGFEQGLVVSLLASQAVIVAVLLYGANLGKITSKFEVKKAAIRYKFFPQFDIWSALLNTASVQLPILLFATYFTSEVVGQYALAHRVLSLPMSLVGGAVAQVFFQKAARLRTDKAAFASLALNTYVKLILVGAISMSIVTFYGENLFSLVFGKNWQQAGQFGSYLSLWLVFVFAASPISNIYTILERQKLGLILNIIMFTARVLSIVIPANAGCSVDEVVLFFAAIGTLLWILQSFLLLGLSGVKPIKSSLATSIIIPVFAIQLIFSQLLTLKP